MHKPATHPVPITTGRMTGPVLGFVAFLCLTLIGVSGYLKFQLDRAEAVLAAPADALAADQGAYDKLRGMLGYSGFMGAAQDFLSTGNRTDLADMKAQIHMAGAMIERLPDKTPPEARHDLEAILGLFKATLGKAERFGAGAAGTYTQADLDPLYASLPILDARVASALATSRLGAEQQLKLWAMLLTFVTWASLVIAAACAAGVYLSLRSRQAAPMRALAQSVRNMSRGDMHTPIWGLERSDMVGEVSRAVDLARYHFSQLPDMSLMSEQGPVRIRFEGNTRSLFEAMMQHIARDSESVRAQAAALADAITRQKEAITHVAAGVGQALEDIRGERVQGEDDIRRLMQSVSGSAQGLHKAQEYAMAQLNRITGYLQERAQGLADLTQITGKQVAQTLSAIDRSEHDLRLSAEQNQETAQRLSSSADDLNDRMASAVALLRAGGKVLNETAEATQSRLNEAADLLEKSEESLRKLVAEGNHYAYDREVGETAHALGVSAGEEHEPMAVRRLKAIVANLEIAQGKLDECLAQQTQAAEARIDLLTTQSNSLLTQATTAAQTFASAADRLRDEQERLARNIEQAGSALEGRLAEGLDRRLAEWSVTFDPVATQLATLGQLTDALGSVAATLGPLNPEAIAAQSAATGTMLAEVKTGFEVTARSIARIREEFLNHLLKQGPEGAVAAEGQWGRIAAQIEAARTSLAQAMTHANDRIEMRLASLEKKTAPADGFAVADTQDQLQQQAQVLSELAAALGAIDAHMQEMEEMFRAGRA
ncbi:MAG TPA: hypothetical protein VMV79_02345 [Alphaproteobacteria bacterium]|nr:hypothetical protein [Alphaproteobacteria bacterium]